MKKTATLFICFFSLFAATSLAQYDSIYSDNMYRTYLLHLPTGYTGNTDLPLIIAMHGGFGNAFNLQNQSQLSIKADAENFIVVYPEGVEGTGIPTWNAGVCCGYAANNNIKDTEFISNLIDSLSASYAIDEDRVYATGMSNGGYMSYRLACELSDKIAAIAPVAAGMTMDVCTPTRAVPVIHFHSYVDSNVVWQGGVGNGFSNHYTPPLDSVMNAWADKNNCTTDNDTIYSSNDYDHIKWGNCDCGYENELYITHDGGHSWPGGKKTITGDTVSVHVNANDKMWEFFQKYSLNCAPTGTANTIEKNNEISVYPNPTEGKFTILLNQPAQINLYNTLGKLLQQKHVTNNKVEMDISHYNKGVYFLMINNNKTQQVLQIHNF